MGNSKTAPILLIVLGIIMIFLGTTGRLGVTLAALFTPGTIGVKNDG